MSRMTSMSQRDITTQKPLYSPGAGEVLSGCPGNGNLPPNLRYSVPLSRYEVYTYQCEDDHNICHKCYSKVFNKSRFGLCAECYNSADEMETLLVVEARESVVYLTRRGRRISLIGPLVKIPIFDRGNLVSHKMIMYRPYVFSDQPLRKRDFDLQLSTERTVKLRAHGIIPADYLLAELD